MKRLGLALLCSSLFFFCGCWSKREINELAIVSSVAIDRTAEKWEILAEIFLPSSSQEAGGGGSSAARQSWLAKGSGSSIFAAIRDLTVRVPRRTYWAHCSAIIVGEEVARSGLIQVLDLWDRDAEARRSAFLFICQGRAAELLTNSFGAMERTVGLELAGLAKTSEVSGYADVKTVHQFMVELAQPGVDPDTAGLVLNTLQEVPGLVPTGKPDLKRGVVVTELHLAKQALFKGTRLVGWLEPQETRGLLWAQGKIKDNVITIEVPGGRGQKIDLEAFNTSRKLTVSQKGGKAQIRVEIELGLGLDMQATSKELVGRSYAVLERKVQAKVEEEMKAALRKAYQLGVDPFGFGHLVRAKDPKLWKRLKGSWPEDLSVEWQVKAKLESSGLSQRGPKERRES